MRCPGCAAVFPVVDGVPILIDEARSLFRLADFQQRRPTYWGSGASRWRGLRRLLPGLSANVGSAAHFQRLGELLKADAAQPRVLVVGGSIAGQGMAGLLADQQMHILETDVALGPRTQLVCDAHDLPFADESFHAVVAQAVLEHVVDPYRCVEEMHRVLVADGLVYAETPFMQQVHGGRFDFTRFTHLGHRRLFRRFDEVESGVVCGPGMALAWAWRYFLLSFASSPAALRLLDVVAHLTGFWLKYLDHILVHRPGALDAASGYYFLGRKSTQVLSDRELIGLYRAPAQAAKGGRRA